MGQRTCSVEDCDLNVLARGWCQRHYDSWRRLGDPEAAARYGRNVGPCAVANCDDPAKAKGYCARHYKAWKEHGSPTPRPRGSVVDGKRICPACQLDLPVNQFGKTATYCLACSSIRTRGYYTPAPTVPLECFTCGSTFAATKRQNLFCSDQCRAAGINKRNWKHSSLRRARIKAATVEPFHARDIYERDDWICGLCASEIERDKVFPHPSSPSIDHVIPIALGGAHSPANAQASHLGCNMRKGARIA